MLKAAVDCLADKKKPVGTLISAQPHKTWRLLCHGILPRSLCMVVPVMSTGARRSCHPHGGLGQRVCPGPGHPCLGRLPGHLKGRWGGGQGTFFLIQHGNLLARANTA